MVLANHCRHQAGIDLAKLHSLDIQGKTFYFTQQSTATIPSPIVHLLPNYDEYVVAYKERRPFLLTIPLAERPTYIDLSYHFVFLDGQLVGGWRRVIGKQFFTVRLNMFAPLTRPQLKALEAARKQLQDFLEMPVTIEPMM